MVKYMLAIDESEHSERAFQFYVDMIHSENDELLLVNAMAYPYAAGSPYVRNDIVEAILDKAEEECSEAQIKFKDLCDQNKIRCEIIAEFGDPGELIVKKAEEHQVTMVILGTRGMGTIRRTILGSVSDYVLHHAHCPVLIARK